MSRHSYIRIRQPFGFNCKLIDRAERTSARNACRDDAVQALHYRQQKEKWHREDSFFSSSSRASNSTLLPPTEALFRADVRCPRGHPLLRCSFTFSLIFFQVFEQNQERIPECGRGDTLLVIVADGSRPVARPETALFKELKCAAHGGNVHARGAITMGKTAIVASDIAKRRGLQDQQTGSKRKRKISGI